MPWPFLFANTDLELGCTNAIFHTIPLDDEGGWVSPPRGPPPPPGQLYRKPSTPKRFCLSAVFIEPGFIYFLCREVSFSCVFCVCFPVVQGFHQDGNVYFPIVFSSNSLYILYIFIFIFF